MSEINRAFRLRRRPEGRVREADLELLEEKVPEPEDGQALVRTTYLSLDPTNRIWMSEHRGYMPPVDIGAVMRGVGVGRVVASRRSDLPEGATVLGMTGWQDYVLADDATLLMPFTVLPDPLPAPPSTFLGVLGHTGITAWLGTEIGDPRPGETVVVSAAGGAVGSIAGQLARERGARVVGVAGGAQKCRHVVEEYGLAACVDHAAPDWDAQLTAATPDGIDVAFESVGGPIMDAVLMRLNVGARVALCGMISDYDNYGPGTTPNGQRAIGQLLMQRATLRGFLVTDHGARFEAIIGELAGLWASGVLRAEETVVEGLENAREALDQLFTGANRGKLVVHVADA